MATKTSGSSPDKRRKYDAAFKAEALRITGESRSTQAAARQLGIRPKLRYRWQQAQFVAEVSSEQVARDPEVRARPKRAEQELEIAYTPLSAGLSCPQPRRNPSSNNVPTLSGLVRPPQNPQSMNTGLTPDTDQTIINLAHAFDGYAYVKEAWQLAEERVHSTLAERLQQMQQTGRLAVRVADNFAVNFYLHRMFHHWGWLPEARSPYWYDMLFLYLHLYRAPIPTTHQHAGMYKSWATRPKGAAEAAAAEIRQVLRRS